ncbi:Os02g0434866 [Oryza sativa Japonica Group]|uniref:Os02g0434866 protein n=1 Tax=Oryza sativa subsp. japonica TaxID=39947 RepID=A0A0P0VIG2_ORYSJ|nr:Os02g0434866 [Oryza sativa Japonica Group]
MSGWGGEAWLDGRSDRRQALRQKGNQSMVSGGGCGWEGAPVGSASGLGVLFLPSRRHNYEASHSTKEPRSGPRKALA